jgi:hypothetical protein
VTSLIPGHYAHIGEKTVRLGTLAFVHSTEPLDAVVPGKIDRVSINDFEDLLAEAIDKAKASISCAGSVQAKQPDAVAENVTPLNSYNIASRSAQAHP